MSVIVIRHGISEANNRDNKGTPAFGHRDAPLMALGREQAAMIPGVLSREYATVVASTAAATSTLLRAQQTAQAAGFKGQKPYPVLDEIPQSEVVPEELQKMRATRVLAPYVLRAAEHALKRRPPEGVWVTHGLLIAGMCSLLNVYQDERNRLIPAFCEVRQLPI